VEDSEERVVVDRTRTSDTPVEWNNGKVLEVQVVKKVEVRNLNVTKKRDLVKEVVRHEKEGIEIEIGIEIEVSVDEIETVTETETVVIEIEEKTELNEIVEMIELNETKEMIELKEIAEKTAQNEIGEKTELNEIVPVMRNVWKGWKKVKNRMNRNNLGRNLALLRNPVRQKRAKTVVVRSVKTAMIARTVGTAMIHAIGNAKNVDEGIAIAIEIEIVEVVVIGIAIVGVIVIGTDVIAIVMMVIEMVIGIRIGIDTDVIGMKENYRMMNTME